MITMAQNKIRGTNRIINHIKGTYNGPTLVFFAGIHGNEKAGVEALQNVLPTLNPDQVYGDIYGLYGNMKALAKNKRFIDVDLNRIWTKALLEDLETSTSLTNEQDEQKAIYSFINQLLETNNNPVYFIDLHTTSSKTLPFITINDAMINRKFSKCFPVPVVLGIEEYLDGPLLSYLNQKGYVSIGFEAGQHHDQASIKNCESFIYLAMHSTGVVNTIGANTIQLHTERLQKAAEHITAAYEVVFKYHIAPKEIFKMKPGFKSFQPIKKGDLLAFSNEEPVYARHSYELFMPLYQSKGNDGFFIIKKIPQVYLKLSEVLRKLKADQLLTVLPGISWEDKNEGVLKANLKVTRFLAKSIFHLFGYRSRNKGKKHLLLYNRERVAKNKLYRHFKWFKN
jgi:succinylglutamate desuccinylase